MNRFVDALSVSEGACNPIAITGVIHKYMLEMMDKGMTTIRQDPAIRLMVHQLAYLCNVDGNFSDYLETLKA